METLIISLCVLGSVYLISHANIRITYKNEVDPALIQHEEDLSKRQEEMDRQEQDTMNGVIQSINEILQGGDING